MSTLLCDFLTVFFIVEVLQVPVYCCQGAHDNRVDQEIS